MPELIPQIGDDGLVQAMENKGDASACSRTHGLFARLTRLYAILAEDPFLWARDVSGIMLRPLAGLHSLALLPKQNQNESQHIFG